jgi:ankyrin repeat protein
MEKHDVSKLMSKLENVFMKAHHVSEKDLERRRKQKENRILRDEELALKGNMDYIHRRQNKARYSKAIFYAKRGDDWNLRQEIELGYDVNERDVVTGRTLLLEAVAAGHFHIVHMLLYEYDADLTKRCLISLSTPLHLAVSLGYRQIASLLLTLGADINATDRRGCTPLHLVNTLSLAKLLGRFQALNPCIRSKEKLRPSEYFEKFHGANHPQFDSISNFLKDKENKYELERAQLGLFSLEKSPPTTAQKNHLTPLTQQYIKPNSPNSYPTPLL